MSDLLLQLLPLIVAAILAPLYPIVVLLLLRSQGGVRKAGALVLGAIAVRLAQGVVFGLVFRAADEAYPDSGSKIIASTLLTVIGILLLISAYKKWQKQEDPDGPPPRWMTAIQGLTPVRAMGAGALMVALSVKQWVFTLAAIDLIAGATTGAGSGAGAYLFYTLATQALVLLPILFMAVAPQQSAKPLDAAQGWLERNDRLVMIAASLFFGVYFLAKGIGGLIG